jgi:acetyl esterase/lipase
MIAALTLIGSLLLTLAAALLGLVVMVPSPTRSIAYLAVVAGEKSYVIIALALAGAFLAWKVMIPGTLRAARFSLLFAFIGIVLACVPPVQAVRLASERHVLLNFGRYLLAPVDIGTAHPHQTVVYAHAGGQALSLDVYRPPPWPTPVPAIVIAHGGGWSNGDKGEGSRASERLAAAGYAVFDVQYRLGPQPNWQTATGDLKCAVAWVKQHAGEVGVNVDVNRVALMGRSAGGHLALLAAYSADDPELASSCGPGDPRVAAVIAYYAPTDLAWGYELPANPRIYDTSQKLRDFLGGPPSAVSERFYKASVVNRVTKGAPRTLLIQGGHDQFVSPEHVDRLVPKLRAAGVAHDTVVIPYGQHGFDYVLGGLGQQIAESAVLAFLSGK